MSACPNCFRGEIRMVDSTDGAVPYDFICSLRCGWQCYDEARTKAHKAAIKLQVKKPKKPKKKVVISNTDSPELVNAIRAECERKMETLLAERAKFPPTYTKQGKPNKKFTEEMRAHMHKFSFTAEQVREEVISK